MCVPLTASSSHQRESLSSGAATRWQDVLLSATHIAGGLFNKLVRRVSCGRASLPVASHPCSSALPGASGASGAVRVVRCGAVVPRGAVTPPAPSATATGGRPIRHISGQIESRRHSHLFPGDPPHRAACPSPLETSLSRTPNTRAAAIAAARCRLSRAPRHRSPIRV